MSADNCLLLFSAQGIIGYNLFAYCGNDPINHVDPNGNEWWHWAIAGCVVIALVAASIVTCGGAAVAAATAAAVVTGTCAVGVSTTAVVVTGAAVGAAIGFGATAVYAAANSSTEDEFMSYGDEAMLLTAVGGALGTVAGALNEIVACFVAGTLVHTDKGLCPIEQIKTGDFVWSWNEETGQTELKRVSECYQRQTTELVHLCLNGEEIVTTPTHPFYVPVRGWTESVKLRAGDLLQTLNGELVVVEWVQHEILEEPVWVYNFQVEEDHCYYVSGTGVLVHNSCNHTSKWTRERRLYWRGMADLVEEGTDYGTFQATTENINRMRQGLAPIGWDGFSVQLHHWQGIANDFYDYSPVSRTLHTLIHSIQKLGTK